MSVDGSMSEAFAIPRIWTRAFALDIDHNRVAAVWGALDRGSDTFWLYGEYTARRTDLGIHAAAIYDRCKSDPVLPAWIPGIFDPRARKRTLEEGDRIVSRLLDLRIDLFTASADNEEAITEVGTRLAAKRLRVSRAMPEWLAEYRNYRRDKTGDVAEHDDGLMRATGLLCLSGVHVAVTDRILDREAEDDMSGQSRDNVTGY